MSSPIRRERRSATALRAALVAVVALGGVALLLRATWPRSIVTTAGGVAIGRLPAGVRVSDLNVVIITLDTTRADRMGAAGRSGAETPVFDQLARDGVFFQHAVTAAPLTLPAHATIF